jgi:hypothetical protein
MPLLMLFVLFLQHEYTALEIEIGSRQYGNNRTRGYHPDGDYIAVAFREVD